MNSQHQLPQVLKPPELTHEHQKYLYESIPPHVALEFQDELFELPHVLQYHAFILTALC